MNAHQFKKTGFFVLAAMLMWVGWGSPAIPAVMPFGLDNTARPSLFLLTRAVGS